MKKHANIPVFIPHMGCPNQCVFCNQRTISGVSKFDISDVKREIDEALSTIDSDTYAEIAFFGGSFTGIDRGLMIELLALAHGYILDGRVAAIRCSTRPDYISDEILAILKRYGVRTIELGLQSSDDLVLASSRRGHSSDAEYRACRMIVDAGFELVGQMMIGLPGSTLEKELETARFIVKSGAVAARIYPTVVFYDTELCELARRGLYEPLELQDAIERSAVALKIFEENNVEVIRIGLCASDNLYDENKYYARPNHSALGEMVVSRLYRDVIADAIGVTDAKEDASLTVAVAKGRLSKAIGHRGVNKEWLIRDLGYANVHFTEDECLSGYQVKVKEERKRKCI